MLLLKPLSAIVVGHRGKTFLLSLWLCIFFSKLCTRIHVRLLSPCFKTGRIVSFRQHHLTPILESEMVLALLNHDDDTPSEHKGTEAPTYSAFFVISTIGADGARKSDWLLRFQISVSLQYTRIFYVRNLLSSQFYWHYSLLDQRLHALLTLFPKSFSSFLHSTCVLLVSLMYLALEEIYLHFSAPFPRNTTHKKCAVRTGLQGIDGILTLSDSLFQETLPCASAGSIFRDYNSEASATDSHFELIPVHSPLLRESWLISLPPLNYMLKFSRYPWLTSDFFHRQESLHCFAVHLRS